MSALKNLYQERKGKRMRVSSYDRTGGNFDFYVINPKAKKVIMDIQASGMITHIWVTMGTFPHRPDAMLERKVVLRMYWDNECEPSVEAPIGDFFGMGHGMSKNFVSAPLTMCPQDGRGYNCYFPMPFEKAARIEVENESDDQMMLYFYIDYEEYQQPPDSPLRFHASWRREITKSEGEEGLEGEYFQFSGENLTGENNYVILEAEGRGHYAGCNLNIHNLRYTNQNNWPGEGDDMIFIDGELWPPRLHGTGCEDYFNSAFCPTQEYNAPYSGIILPGGPNWSGKITYYRYHILDPIMFNKSIKVTIEHGHNNNRFDDYSSTAYWYQTEPHKHYPILPVSQRIPLPDIERDLHALFKMKAERDARARQMGIEE